MAREETIFFKQIEVGMMQNFVYLIGSGQTKEAVVVDPAWEVDRILEEARKEEVKITGALITHTHFDHVNGVEDLLEALPNTKIYVHKAEAGFLPKESANIVSVSGGEKIPVGDLEIQLIHTPGHTPGSQCFLVQNSLVSGDTLFIGACGRCDLPGGDPKQMYESLTQRLMKLPEGTVIYPGHNYADQPSSTLKRQKQENPFMKFQSLNDFMEFMGYGRE